MTPERVASKLQSIRDELDHADLTKVPSAQIGAILIAIGTLTDIVEAMQPVAAASDVNPYAIARQSDPYADARHEYQAERRIDEWSSYMREDDRHSAE